MDPARWSRLEGLMFTARSLVEGLYAGGHASPRPGPGTEFHDYRPYVPGDDPAAIDWKLFGRTDRHYVRRYRRYTDLRVQLAVDVSASMGFAGLSNDGRPSKLEVAKELAAAVAFLAVRQADRVGLGLIADSLTHALPIRGTWGHLQALVAALERAERSEGAADLGTGLAQLDRVMTRRGLVVVISDLLDEPGGLFDGIARLRHRGCEVVVFQVLTAEELDIAHSPAPRWRLIDPESRREVATHVPTVAAGYREAIGAHIERVRAGCVGRGADHRLVRTDEAVVEALRGYVAWRGAVS